MHRTSRDAEEHRRARGKLFQVGSQNFLSFVFISRKDFSLRYSFDILWWKINFRSVETIVSNFLPHEFWIHIEIGKIIFTFIHHVTANKKIINFSSSNFRFSGFLFRS